MPVSFWLGLGLGAPLWVTLGFFVGRWIQAGAATGEANRAETQAKIDTALKIDDLQDELKETIKETQTMSPEQLADALNDDFDNLPGTPIDLTKPVRPSK